MSARIIDGKAAAARVLEQVSTEVKILKADGIEPALAVILVGNDPASEVYVRNKILRAEEAGIRSLEHRLPAKSSQAQVLALIAELNADDSVNGILLQLPLPSHMEEARALQAIDPGKDVDGFHSENVGGLSQGRSVLTPCTPSGCMHLLEETCGDLSGKHAVVIGRSNIVGKPMAALLLQAHCSVTVVHSRSTDAKALCQLADIVVAAVGRPRIIDASWLKPGAVVIDVGINRIEDQGRSRLVGDVDFDSALSVASAITPVPGGVGPMTIAFLMKNTVTAARQQALAQRSQSEAVCLSTY
ncbi:MULTISPECIES: bifunctional methylenetetrahydrofolate dehydrogenase/methenyltetrahydrofolate cyclohydrolase FolD [Pseudomonas syringae group genomosp. 2]|uniref:bifunctional methylenetetrahydrofolate dehydrogenase/methenyltetrahydrofolate cyclohydrolase FolD n=1 Tax=Pseudomonas syringae group genomosp. 2 TaxID=251698 RepID=UPI0006B9D24D|nr:MULTISPECIES: bifunctional methylenetetrahydrofolate dehydrogenase/methenyltetrahydrofolate cyclohydrolase FolD [Pseudomonas syringae group genomosp. 2]KPB16574.1 Bifunctional protein FolD [Pseudomonas amygdali pv. sesami]KPY58872.1 Bifunctional protein FolD [Pseudomonas amygdali pv. sesami]RMT93631.1 Bifunctional protein FolD [Pseudomonas amygdali pv. sesami]RMU03609.1 Bifunctional protein FolD [Pseudomonas amygdali pv. sesami]RMV84663.1 Bifunctional protein FolD [Pseudomonas amygdali pv. 